MNRCFIFYLLIAFFVECFARFGTRDAFDYKKSNNRIKKQKELYATWRNLFRIYPHKDTFAPRHIKLFFLVRIVNLILIFIVMIVFAYLKFEHTDILVYYIIMILLSAIFFIPFIAYMIYLVILSKYPHKKITYDKFKKP